MDNEKVRETSASLLAEGWRHVAYYDEGQFHWVSGIAPRDCELYQRVDQPATAHRLAPTAQPEVKALVEALEAIKAQTSAEDDAGENYRWDDREGALDFAYATAAQALAAYHDAQP
tara:strand:- start:1003 stop:1350 length:348 start_codon:yes stop_codon:yes gene_type:complete